MKIIRNLFYTVFSKTVTVLCILIFTWQLSTCFSTNTVLYRENKTALKNVYLQWDDYTYETSEYLKAATEKAIDEVMQYSLYYHRDSTDENDLILNADDNYKNICRELASYKDFSFAVVNHTTGIIVSDIPSLSYAEAGADVRSFFEGDDRYLLSIRDAHNPCFENGSITQYNDYIALLAEAYTDSFDLYIYFADSFSFPCDYQDFEKTHCDFLSRVKKVTVMSAIYFIIIIALSLLLFLVSGKNEVGGKVYPGLSDRLPNDLKLLLFIIVFLSMSALYENSLYMAIRAGSYNLWPSYSSDFYIIRSYVSMTVNATIFLSAICTLKRQIHLGTLFTNTYIYKFFFARYDKQQ